MLLMVNTVHSICFMQHRVIKGIQVQYYYIFLVNFSLYLYHCIRTSFFIIMLCVLIFIWSDSNITTIMLLCVCESVCCVSNVQYQILVYLSLSLCCQICVIYLYFSVSYIHIAGYFKSNMRISGEFEVFSVIRITDRFEFISTILFCFIFTFLFYFKSVFSPISLFLLSVRLHSNQSLQSFPMISSSFI